MGSVCTMGFKVRKKNEKSDRSLYSVLSQGSCALLVGYSQLDRLSSKPDDVTSCKMTGNAMLRSLDEMRLDITIISNVLNPNCRTVRMLGMCDHNNNL